jgi:hypothetical protein
MRAYMYYEICFRLPNPALEWGPLLVQLSSL